MAFLPDIGVLSAAKLSWCELISNTFSIPQIPLAADANFLRVHYDPSI